jgi:hypothetical protein
VAVINSSAYRKLIDENIAWLRTMPRTLERDHIEQVLLWHSKNAAVVTAFEREKERQSGLGQ